MAQYLIEFDGNKYIIQAPNSQNARNIFMQTLEMENIVKISKIVLPVGPSRIKFVDGKKYRKNRKTELIPAKLNIKVTTISDLLSKRSTTLGIETKDKKLKTLPEEIEEQLVKEFGSE